ncbi:MAG: hypothetical protein H0U73_08270 [Tatlockia sp.]|nr:hypothetical protein [Tatlockia sp.]
MIEFLRKAFGAIGGMILYPLKSLLVNLVLLALIPIAAVIALVVLPFVAAYFVVSLVSSFKFFKGLGSFFAAAIVAALAAPFVTLFFMSYQIVRSFYDLPRTFIFGAQDGIRAGITHVISRALFDFRVFSSAFQKFIMRLNGEVDVDNRASNHSDYESLNIEELTLAEGSKSDKKISLDSDVIMSKSLHHSIKSAKTVLPLSSEEMRQAEDIRSELGDLWSNFVSLQNRKYKLDDALNNLLDANSPLENIKCELTGIEITRPALLTKLYFDEKQQDWKVISGETKITDKSQFETYIDFQNPKKLDSPIPTNLHPVTMEALDLPNKVKINGQAKSARYRLEDYNENTVVEELADASVEIRNKINQAKPENIKYDKVIAQFKTNILPSFFFNPQENITNSEEKESLLPTSKV